MAHSADAEDRTMVSKFQEKKSIDQSVKHRLKHLSNVCEVPGVRKERCVTTRKHIKQKDENADREHR